MTRSSTPRRNKKAILCVAFVLCLPLLYVGSYGLLRATHVLVHQEWLEYEYPETYRGTLLADLDINELCHNGIPLTQASPDYVGHQLNEVDLIEVNLWYRDIGWGSALNLNTRGGHISVGRIVEASFYPLRSLELFVRGLPHVTEDTLIGDEPSNNIPPDTPEELKSSGAWLGPIKYHVVDNDLTAPWRQRRGL